MREASLSLMAIGRRCDLAQLAVDAEAHAVVVLVRLEVQVGRPHAEGIQQHLVQELDDRRVLDFARPRLRCPRWRRLHGDFVELEIVADDAVHCLGGAGRRGFHHLGELVVFGNDPVHAHLGGELDFFRRLLVRRVGGGDDQAVVALAQHHHAVGLADLGVQQVLGQPLQVDGVQVQQRRAKGGDRVCARSGGRNRPGPRQFGDEAGAVGLGLVVNVLR